MAANNPVLSLTVIGFGVTKTRLRMEFTSAWAPPTSVATAAVGASIRRARRDPEGLGHRGQQGKPDQAEGLEVDPGLKLVVVHDVQIESADHGEIHDPQRVELPPHRGLELDCMPHDALGEGLRAEELAAEVARGEQPVDYGQFPLKDLGVP